MRLIPCLALMLTACASNEPIAVQIKEVQVPVPVPCAKAEQIPPEPGKVGDQLTGNPVTDAMILAESALELRKWGGELEALVNGCV